ncbi:heme peroxidase [Nemania sp. FL0031]|nr:heme peroxidase [Nemania sp. FL0031]
MRSLRISSPPRFLLMQSCMLHLLLLHEAAAMFYYPSAQVSQLEHILVDNWGAHASNFSSAITPCDRYVTEVGDAAVNSGRTTSAQWLRVVFHDFVTANVTAGTGGVDASIGFETFRDENKGSAFNDSFTFWRPFVNEFVPMADLVALGTVMSVNLCGSGEKTIPYRPGRVDAVQADLTTGVPEPGTSLEETLEQFERSGFNQVDAIGLTACGHTLGSVHHSGFPEVADDSQVSVNNTNGGMNFDTTRGTFDARVVHEYVDDTGNRGGALVTSYNATSRSDLRLYASDGNATMRALYAQGEDGFLATCADLFTRMIETVPAGVALGGVVQPMSVKPINVTWDVAADGRLVLSGSVRLLNAKQAKPAKIAFSNGYTTPLSFETTTGTSVFGTTQFAPFAIDHAHISSSSSFSILGANLPANKFTIQDSSFIVPSLSTVEGTSAKVTIAVKKGAKDAGLSAQITVPTAQPLTLGPKMVSTSIGLTKAAGGPGGFTFWQGNVDIEQPTGAVSIRLVRDTETLDTLLLDAGVAGW